MTSARIGHLTQGGIQSIALHEDGPDTAKLLLNHWNTPERVYWLIDGGNILRLRPEDDEYETIALRTTPHEPPTNHPDNDWPNTGQRHLYLYQQDTWWHRQAKLDGAWPDKWEPLTT